MSGEVGPAVVTAALVIIGNEILSGRTQDANLAWIARRLGELGIRLGEVRVVADRDDAIGAAVNGLRATHDYVFTTGGIGPTHDDITARALAAAFRRRLAPDAEAVRRLEAHYARSGIEFNRARMKMAEVPEGARLIDNPVSAAPGFQIENVFVLAGVPAIMQAQFDGLGERLVGGAPLVVRTLGCRLPEGTLAPGLGDIQAAFADVEIGSYPYYRQGDFGVKLVLRAADAGRLDAAVRRVMALVDDLGGAPVEEPPV